MYPEIEVNIKSYDNFVFKGEMDINQRRNAVEGEKKADINTIKTINTELMSGKGPDIIDVSNKLPLKKYIEKNMVLNISDYISKDKNFDINTCFTNIIEAYKYKGSLYAMPIGINFDILAADSAVLDDENIVIDDTKWTWNDFIDICKKAKRDLDGDGVLDRYALLDMGYTELFDPIFKSSYARFVDTDSKNAKLDTEEFIDLLNICKSFYDDDLMHPSVNYTYMSWIGGNGAVAFFPFNVFSYRTPYSIKRRFNSLDIGMLNIPSGQDMRDITCNIPFALAINKNCKYKDEAWEFIKIMASDEIQSSEDLHDFPINRKGIENHIASIIKHNEQILKEGKSMFYVFTDYDINKLNYFINNCTKVSDFDPQVMMIVDEEILPFFEGRRPAEEVAKIVQDKVMTYLNE
jgi:ABC-type glycerol-3-phosphate transport system substrate-binding protein